MKHILSLTNPEVKKIVALHDKKGRQQHQQFIVDGLRSVTAFLDAGWQPQQLYMTQRELDKHGSQFAAFPVTSVSDPVMKKISSSITPSGLTALFAIPPMPTLEKLEPCLVLAEVSDSGNMGTLIRTSAALGFSSIILIGGVDPWSPKVIQATAGAAALVKPLCMKWEQLLQVKKQLVLCALVPTGGESPERVDFCDTLLVVGNEAHGIPASWLADCERRLTLPMPGATESLNAAIAGSIALYLRYMACSRV